MAHKNICIDDADFNFTAMFIGNKNTTIKNNNWKKCHIVCYITLYKISIDFRSSKLSTLDN